MPQTKTGKWLRCRVDDAVTWVRRHPAARLAGKTLMAAAAGFLLAGAEMAGRPLPLPLALCAAMGFTLPCVGCYIGAAAGYFWLWDLSLGLEPIAAGFLILAGLCLLGEFLPEDQPWFVPACASALYLMVGLIFLLDTGNHAMDAIAFGVKLVLIVVCGETFTEGLREKTPAGLAALALSALAGCGRWTLFAGVPVSVPLAVCAVILGAHRPWGLLCAAACGLTVDLTAPLPCCMTVQFLAAVLVVQRIKTGYRSIRAVVFAGGCFLSMLLLSQGDAAAVIGVMLGSITAMFVPETALAWLEAPKEVIPQSPDALELASGLLARVSRILTRRVRVDLEPQSAAVFDRAAEQVCAGCALWQSCWEQNAAETYIALSRSAEAILRRGEATRDNMPGRFLSRCCRADSFLAAVNDALESQIARRQYFLRLAEAREVLSDQYQFLAAFLTTLSEQEPEKETELHFRFEPELGFRAQGMRGSTVSGDRGASFQKGEWYYLLLCDGMGTGQEAAQESETAITILQGLIRAGFDAQDSLRMLNGVYILRGDGGFSTVDLLQISLVTGEGFLHKWGAAPSYLRRERQLQKIGTATPPPGLGVGEAHRWDCVRLSMQEGEVLVLLSDGIAAARAEAFLKSCGQLPSREMAARLAAEAPDEEPDDRSAAVLCLRPVARQEKHSTARARILSKARP